MIDLKQMLANVMKHHQLLTMRTEKLIMGNFTMTISKD
jgi:hypothetical protein